MKLLLMSLRRTALILAHPRLVRRTIAASTLSSSTMSARRITTTTATSAAASPTYRPGMHLALE
ncbi:unnamed protein product, partial [Amoebophrya sp. A25]|eukprot:GSA25T00007928001.1